MNESTYEAAFLGVNSFIFVIALSAGIILMSNILDMVNYANNNASAGLRGSLAESVGIVETRTYNAKDLLTYYRKYIDEEANGKSVYYVKNSANESGMGTKIDNYIKNNSLDFSNIFELVYNGKNNKNQDIYIFVKQ